ncbi:MAG: cation:proton antiporter [Acidimicrobiia bacterium]|nr:cation:proton antiporter [Acidimicrobiia bacterium]
MWSNGWITPPARHNTRQPFCSGPQPDVWYLPGFHRNRPDGGPVVVAESSSVSQDVLLQLFVILAGAQLAALLFRRLRQPVVVGEILAGVLLGPSVLGWVDTSGGELSQPLVALAELGVIVLMFLVGLETPVKSIARVGGRAFTVAVGGVILPFVCGWLAMVLLDHSSVEALFVGTAMVATSVGVTARVLGELGMIDREFSRIILGAAVIDDVLGLLVLTVVKGIAESGVNFGELGLTLGLTAVFVGVLLTLGPRAVRRAKPRLQAVEPSRLFLLSLLLLLGLAAAASYIGLAAIVGAFLAGVIIAEEVDDFDLVHQTEVLGSFLTPVFFVGVGAAVDLGSLGTAQGVLLVVLIVGLAIASKFAGAGAASRLAGVTPTDSVIIGVGMVPRGEVGIVVASIALASGEFSETLFGVVVTMSVVTTLVAPPLLSVLIARADRRRAGSLDSGE